MIVEDYLYLILPLPDIDLVKHRYFKKKKKKKTDFQKLENQEIYSCDSLQCPFKTIQSFFYSYPCLELCGIFKKCIYIYEET